MNKLNNIVRSDEELVCHPIYNTFVNKLECVRCVLCVCRAAIVCL